LWHYVENKNLDQNIVVECVAEIQKWIDTGISMELLFNLNNPEINAKYIFEVLVSAWENGCKAIYYVRTITKTSATERNSEEACVTCAN
jgi:ribonucleoside-diphosphate reductase alpha chain